MERQTPKSDRELGKEMQLGKDDAYKEVVDRFIRPIYSICLKCLRDPVEAQDVTQDVFLRMHKGIATYDVSRPLSSWLFRIAYNRCMDYLKKRGRNIEIQMNDIEVSSENMHAPVDHEENAKVIDLLWGSLDELPEPHRIILLFKYRFSMKNSEIAEALGITENNLRVKLFRAKQELRLAVSKKLQKAKG